MPAICRHLLGISSDAFSSALTADFHDEQTTVLAPDPDRCGRSHIGRGAPSNSRRTSHNFASALAGSLAELHFAHGLYVTLTPKRMLDEYQTKQIAADLCGDLGRRGLPLRHAGSFGFDFGAAEWFHDKTGNRYLVRIAIPDLPTSLWDAVVQAVAQWWSVHERHQLRRFAVRSGYNAV